MTAVLQAAFGSLTEALILVVSSVEERRRARRKSDLAAELLEEREERERRPAHGDVLHEVNLLVRALLRVVELPERVHPDGDRKHERGEQERTEVRPQAEGDEQTAADRHQTRQRHEQLRRGNVVRSRVRDAVAPLDEMDHDTRDDKDRREENPSDQQNDVHGFLLCVRTLESVHRGTLAALTALAGLGAYRLVASGAATIDVGIGRRVRRLGPRSWDIGADRELVFDVIAGPYLGPTPRALEDKLAVWQRGSDMVLAAHFTPVKCGVATTVETVRFERPSRIDFRVVRGPVPHVVESFVLDTVDDGTRLTWEGELGTDLWALGAWWGHLVARAWEKAVRSSLEAVISEAERRVKI
jgi:hypothetical protein